MTVNLYDFDKTIYDGDSTIDFYIFCLKKNILLIRFLPYQLFFALLYKLNIVSKKSFKQSFFKFLKGINDADKYISLFWEKNDKKIKHWYLERNHDSDIIISASPKFLLLPISIKLGTLDLIATDVDKNSGLFLSDNCSGEVKVKMLYDKYNNITVNEAYTDSMSDLPMLKLSKKAFLIRKDKISEYK